LKRLVHSALLKFLLGLYQTNKLSSKYLKHFRDIIA
jgi:hypothetical protein